MTNLQMAIAYNNVAIPKTQHDFSQREVECLSEAIYHESRGEPLEGKKAVANVVLNRLESNMFPSSICKVVYQRKQFSWTTNKPRVTDKESWKKSKELANQIIQRHYDKRRVDNTKGSLFFRTDKPHKNRRFVKVIGRHYFSK
jgi:Cell wall hydrolyses involved in spore germination